MQKKKLENWMKSLLIILTLISLLVAKPVAGENEPTPNGPSDALEACEGALVICIETIKAKNEVIKQQDELVTELIKQRNEALKEAISSKPMLPSYIWIVIGASAGVLAMEFAR